MHFRVFIIWRNSIPLDQRPQRQSIEKSCFLLIEGKVAAGWRTLGRHLELDADTLSEIDSDYKSAKDKCAAVLEKWKKMEGVDMGILKKELDDMGRRDVVEEIRKLEHRNRYFEE